MIQNSKVIYLIILFIQKLKQGYTRKKNIFTTLMWGGGEDCKILYVHNLCSSVLFMNNQFNKLELHIIM